jgi:hypothetical protein
VTDSECEDTSMNLLENGYNGEPGAANEIGYTHDTDSYV